MTYEEHQHRVARLRNSYSTFFPLHSPFVQKLTPLELAIKEPQSAIVKVLLDRGADTNRCSIASLTPLLRACHHGSLNIVKLLVERGSDVTAKTLDGSTCLSVAAQNRHLSLVSYLLEQKTSPINGVDANGCTILHHVVLLNDANLTSTLISKGVEINAQTHIGETPLFLASKNTCTESLKELLDSGADPNICTKGGESPFLAAASEGNIEVLQMLMTAGQDNKREIDKDWAQLVIACSAGCLKTVRLLVENRADLAAQTPNGVSCLSVAAMNKNRSIVSYLLKRESCPVDVDVAVKGYTLLHHVVMFNDPVATSYLISKGLNIDAETQDGETPVFLAIKHRCLASSGVLLNSGADLNVKTKNGDFALKEAVNQGNVDMVTSLLEQGADSTTFIKDGYSPIELAKEVDIKRQQKNNTTSSVVQQGGKPTILQTANEAFKFASNVKGMVDAALEGL